MCTFLLRTDSGLIGLYIFLSIFLACILTIIIVIIINNKRNKRVLNSSPYIQKIKQLNIKYHFKKLNKISDTKKYFLKSKKEFDRFNYYSHASDFVNSSKTYFEQIIESIDYNISLYKEYNSEFLNIPVTNDLNVIKKNKMSLKSYNKREVKLGKDLFKKPQTNYCLYISWEYTSPAGRNHYFDRKEFSHSTIKKMLNIGQSIANVTSSKSNKPSSLPSKPNTPTNTKTYTNDDIDDILDD